MPLTIQQLLQPVSAADFRTKAVAALQGLGLSPQLWAPGGGLSTTLTIACNLVAMLSTQLSNGISQQWNPTATGGGLQLLSKFFYGVSAPQPTFATGNLVLTNIGGGIFTYAPGTAFFASTVANSQGVIPTYTNVSAFTLNAGSPSSPTQITIPIICTFAGSGGSSAPGFITSVPTAMISVTASNPIAVTGSDALSDAALRNLNIASIAARSVFGPTGAYVYAIQVATNSVTGLPVAVNRWSLSNDHQGNITIYVASPTGPVITTDLQGISNAIEKYARPDGVTVLPGAPGFPSQPASATAVPYDPSITVYVLAPIGTTATTLQTTILAALDAWFGGTTNPIGGLVASDDTEIDFYGIFYSGI